MKNKSLLTQILNKSKIIFVLLLSAIILTFVGYYCYKAIEKATYGYWIQRQKNYVPEGYVALPVQEEDHLTATWLIHMYPPAHNAGAEWMAHAMNLFLVREGGWRINVVLNKAPVSEFERVMVYSRNDIRSVAHCIQHSSVLISHLDNECSAVMTAIRTKRPLVCVMHNNYRKKYLDHYQYLLPKNLYFIHNSEWIKNYYSEYNVPSIVVYPPVYWQDYATETTREYVTLINLNKNKGGDVLIKIARQMPDVQFMGVKGGYDGQIMNSNIKNIYYAPNTPFIKDMYAKTDILLVPSKEESWGRVAVEAMSSGIPVIAHPTPGLLESCGDAGIFCDRNDIGSWVAAIRRLKTDTEYYNAVSARCLARAKELDPAPQLREMNRWLKSLTWKE